MHRQSVHLSSAEDQSDSPLKQPFWVVLAHTHMSVLSAAQRQPSIANKPSITAHSYFPHTDLEGWTCRTPYAWERSDIPGQALCLKKKTAGRGIE